MNLNRRDFVVRSSLLVSAGLLGRSGLSAVPEQGGGAAPGAPKTGPVMTPAGPVHPVVTEFKALRGDVGYFTGRGGTIGWLSTPDALVAVDTQFPDTAAVFIAGVPEPLGRGRKMFDVVLNTHHHADHTGGNGVFRPVARTIVAQANVPALMRAAAEKTKSPTAPTYPDTTFTDAWRRELGGEVVTARYFGPAHTSGDVVIHFEKANVVHTGDLQFNRLYPVIDRPVGASIRGWITRLEEIVKTYPADAIYLCGHGNPKFGVTGGHADLLVLRDYFTAVLEHVQRGIAAGEPKEKIVALENLPGFPDFHTPLPNRLGGNLSVAYDELTEKKTSA